MRHRLLALLAAVWAVGFGLHLRDFWNEGQVADLGWSVFFAYMLVRDIAWLTGEEVEKRLRGRGRNEPQTLFGPLGEPTKHLTP